MRNHLPSRSFLTRACTIRPTVVSTSSCACCGESLTIAKGILFLLGEPTGFYQAAFTPTHKRQIVTMIILIDTGSPHLFYYDFYIEGHMHWLFRDARELQPQFVLRGGYPPDTKFHTSLLSVKQYPEIYRLLLSFNYAIADTDPHLSAYLQGNHLDDPAVPEN